MLSGLGTVVANSCIVDSSEHVFAGPAWTCPSSAASRSSSEPLLWAYSLHRSGQSELCCYAAPAGRAFPVLVSASIAVHRHPFAIFVWIDFLKAPGNILFFLFFSSFSNSTQFPPKHLPPPPPQTRIKLRIINKETLVQDRKQSLKRPLFLACQCWEKQIFLIFGGTN